MSKTVSSKSKRKALNVINEEIEDRVDMEQTNRRKLAATNDDDNDEDDRNGDPDFDPTNSNANASLAAFEKRKRISKNFCDLSQIADSDMRMSSSSELAHSSQMSSQISKRSASKTSNKAGIIEEIYLKNFKCHDLLEFKLHKYINFILGRNGSGKSAVMDGVILCLGGKTSCTGRQASVKTFIKTNCDKAELRITLSNEGVDTYKPDQYGSKILIERRLSRDGQSMYKVMNENHKIISTKKSEVDNIIEQFNIQVDNPVCFLNQETSKHFLASANQSEKYKLFLKASQLDTMRRMLEQIENERKASEAIIEEKSVHLPLLEQEVHVWEQKYKKCQSVEKLRQKLSLLIKEFSWAQVVAREKTIDTLEKDKRAIDKSKEKHLKKIDEHKDQLKMANEKKECLTSKINSLTEQSRSLRAKEAEANEALAKVQQIYRGTQIEVKKLKSMMAKKKTDRDELVAKLTEEKKSSRDDYEDEKRQKEEKLADMQQKIDDVQTKLNEKGQEAKRYDQEIENKKKAIRDKNFDIKNYERTIENCEADITKLVNAKKDQIFKFGDFMPALVNDMKTCYEQNKFKQQPRGPIGMYVEPRSQEWSLAIEQCLGALLFGFICGSYEDERLMHALIAKHVPQVNKRPRVIVADFRAAPYNVAQYRPENRSHPTVYEMLRCDDSAVANTLIDQRRIESILLLPGREVGRNMIERGQCGANCQEAFLMNGDQLLGKPSYRAYACQFKSARFFVTNPDQIISTRKKEIERAQENLRTLRAEIDTLQEQITNSLQAKTQIDRQIDRLKREQLLFSSKLREIESIVIPEPLDIAVFEDEIARLEKEMDDCKYQIEHIEESTNSVREEFESGKRNVDKNEEEKKELKKAIDEIKIELADTEQERTKHEEAVQHYVRLYEEIVAKESDLDTKINTEKNELVNHVRAAEEVSPRIEVNKSVESIDKEIVMLEKQIQQSQNLHENENEITKMYLERKATHKKIKEDIKKNEKFLKMLAEAMKLRESAAQQFTEAKGLRCSMDFQRYANSRHYNGNLIFNHQEQKLDIVVNPSKTREGNQVKDLKSLSGGERSFSTVAFLLSLWSIVESPVLFLDEFDVFMDQINRTYAMELILAAAKEALNGQYVFLTPQEMGSIKPDNYVKMFKMPDPKRAIDMVGNRDQDDRN